MHKKNWVILLLAIILLASCQSAQPETTLRGIFDWQYSDLRLLDTADSNQPSMDVIAAYTRMNGPSFQIRIDYLDSAPSADSDIYIAIDAKPGGISHIASGNGRMIATDIAWDYLIKIPASERAEFVDDRSSPVYGSSLFIVRDRTLDSDLISFNKHALPLIWGRTHIQVIVTPPHQNLIADQTEPFSIDAPSPARARVLFAFWNTFASTTPAQALRSWSGAHAGPMRSRHGLQYLLDAIDQTDANAALLDLAKPDTLSALDYLGALPEIENLVNRGYLEVPGIETDAKDKFHTLADEEQLFDLVRKLDITKLLGRNKFEIDLFEDNLDNNIFYDYFMSVNDYAQFVNYDCPLSIDHSTVTTTSFSITCKKLFLFMALNQPTPPYVMGGDFSTSVLGIPSISRDVFSYVKYHPWIQLISLKEYQLETDRSSNPPLPYLLTHANSNSNENSADTIPQLEGTQFKVYHDLLNLPDNEITNLVWQAYETLISPGTSAQMTLRANYLGQIGEIVAAANWAEAPTFISTCSRDLDYDGLNECILANNTLFVIVEPEGGIIPFVFSKDKSGAHQIIGPTWEFVVGLSDPSTWDFSKGVGADKEQILGALSSDNQSVNTFDYYLEDDKINLYNVRMTMRKSVHIGQDQLEIDLQYRGDARTDVSIPLVLDPWTRYTSGWGDHYVWSSTPNTYLWSIESGISVKISSTTQLQGFPFNATHTALSYPENPNYDYSRGHYLPFPMALVEIFPAATNSIAIIITP